MRALTVTGRIKSITKLNTRPIIMKKKVILHSVHRIRQIADRISVNPLYYFVGEYHVEPKGLGRGYCCTVHRGRGVDLDFTCRYRQNIFTRICNIIILLYTKLYNKHFCILLRG